MGETGPELHPPRSHSVLAELRVLVDLRSPGQETPASDPDAQLRLRRRRIRIVAGVALAALTFDFFLAVRHGFFDLHVYHGAINYWVHDRGSIYDYVLPFSTYGFTYPPFAALLMLPMAITPWHLAIALSAISCAAASLLLIYWLVDPMARRHGWTRWYAVGLIAAFAIAFEPLRETFLFGQVNMYLVVLVAADLLFLVTRGSRFAGVAVGLATAIKLTPGIFILYLLVTKRWRPALVASVTAAAATLFAAAVAPDASRVFWTDAVWNTDRVGALAFISNQSLNGAVARLHEADPSSALWAAAVLLVLAIWVVRVRRAAAVGDERTGFALTGVVGCLISPVTWVHHLVWVGPAVLLLLDHAGAATSTRRRRRLFGFMIFSYLLLCSRLVWSFSDRWGTPVTWFFSNSYVWLSLALLIALPIGMPRGLSARAGDERDGPSADIETSADVEAIADVEATADAEIRAAFDRAMAGLIDGERTPAAAKPEESVAPSG